jgi:hypothetical protein
MRHNDVSEQLQRRPFQPFRLHLTDGTVFDVSHPEGAILGHGAVTLALPPALGLHRQAVIDLLHVIWLELLVPETLPGTDGGGAGPAEPPPSQ